MRTKALVCAAVLGIGIASTMAQSVYSLNVVGYYNVTIPANSLQMIANQFNTTNNTIAALIPNPPPYANFYKYTTGVGYTLYQFDPDVPGWQPDGNATLNPGEGGFLDNVDVNPLTLTFVGEVPQGTLGNPLPSGYAIRSSMVPQAGGVDTLGIVPGAYDEIYKYGVGGYTLFQYDPDVPGWQPTVPAVSVGESFFYNNVNASNYWVRNFTVQ